MTRRLRPVAAAAAGMLLLPALVLGATGSGASAPATAAVTLPPVGMTATDAWKGTVAPGADATSDCNDGLSPVDMHTVTFTEPTPPRPASAISQATFSITWTPTTTSKANDLVLTVDGPDGKEVGSSDSSNTTETVTIDAKPGTYKVLACGFANSAAQPYDGALSVRTFVREVNPPSADPQGLQFSATVPSDPQRDEGEPAVTTDRAGNIYTCGPSGFSQIADYAQVSTDNGRQFHLLGTPPRGQISAGEGGGDCALATSPVPNGQGKYTLAYAGLGPLTNFSTATSDDAGRRVQGSPVSESVPGVDRQWITFTDAKTAFLNYNSSALGQVVQKSVDGGLTYSTPGTVAATDGDRIGQIRSFLPPGKSDRPTESVVYFPYTATGAVKIAISQDGGTTWSQCVAIDTDRVDPNAGFATADNDDAGNVYVTYSEKGGGRDTFLSSVTYANLQNCKRPARATADTNPGFTPKLRMNRGAVETSLFPWVAAGGAPGRVAVAFYGTESVGDPDDAKFKATWNVYVSQVVDAFADAPAVAMVKATTHPFHYDSICTGGLGCTIRGADRSLVDYFTLDYNRGNGRLSLVYSQGNKKPDEPEGHVALPAVLTQIGGPSNGGGAVAADRQVLAASVGDDAGDAITAYSELVGPGGPRLTSPVVRPALDLVGADAVKVSSEVDPATGAPVNDPGGFTVTMRYADLSDAALNSALGTQPVPSTSLTYLFRFVNGYQGAGVLAKWDPLRGFRFGYDDYTTQSVLCGSSGEKCEIYPGNKPIKGHVDPQAGTITLSVPASYLRALSGPSGNGQRPKEVPAGVGSRLYDATAFTFASPLPPEAQSFMEQVDSATSFDFLVPAVGSAASGGPGNAGAGSGSGSGNGRATSGSLAATGLSAAVPVVALAALLLAGLLRRRSRSDR